MKELKEKYSKDFQRVRILVNEFDPCGLISNGAPVDEYDCLINKILSGYYGKKTKEEIRKIILDEVKDHFGIDMRSIKEHHKHNFYRSLDDLLTKLDERNI